MSKTKRMSKEIIITGFNTTGEGVSIELNKPTKLKTGNVSGKSFWVSWDKIGDLLFENYTDKTSVEDRDKLRS